MGGAGGAQANGSMVMVDNTVFSNQKQGVAQPVQVQQNQQQYVQEMGGGNEMYANFQQAQMQNYDDGGQGQQVSACGHEITCCVE